jgi:hypothetical protein
MRSILDKLCMALVLPVILASLLLVGCGSAGSSDYQLEVSALNKETAEKLEESLHLLGESGHGEEEAGSESVVSSLEEAVLVMEEALAVLEKIKVPAGWEDYQRDLTSFYHANLAAYEAYLAALVPAEENAEGESQGEEEGAEIPEEENTSDGEAPLQEEAPAEGGGH